MSRKQEETKLERIEELKIEGTRTTAENVCSAEASDLVEKVCAAEKKAAAEEALRKEKKR
jgi:hypothetical protein